MYSGARARDLCSAGARAWFYPDQSLAWRLTRTWRSLARQAQTPLLTLRTPFPCIVRDRVWPTVVGPRPPVRNRVCLAATASPSPLATPSPPLSEGPAALRAAAPGRLGVRRAGGAERGASSHRPKKTLELPGEIARYKQSRSVVNQPQALRVGFHLLWSRGLGCPWRVSFVHSFSRWTSCTASTRKHEFYLNSGQNNLKCC